MQIPLFANPMRDTLGARRWHPGMNSNTANRRRRLSDVLAGISFSQWSVDLPIRCLMLADMTVIDRPASNSSRSRTPQRFEFLLSVLVWVKNLLRMIYLPALTLYSSASASVSFINQSGPFSGGPGPSHLLREFSALVGSGSPEAWFCSLYIENR